MAETFAVTQAVRKKLKELGYSPDTSMLEDVERWWLWYTATDPWYRMTRDVLGHKFHVMRRSVHPARFVCREWASAILDDDGTTITVEEMGEDRAPDDGEPDERRAAQVEDVSDWLNDWCDRNKFVSKAQMTLERAFALGTAAMALWFHKDASGELHIRPRRYDARMVLPLTWDDDEVRECAFVTTARYKGKAVDQLQCHLLQEDGYHVRTFLFEKGKEDPIVDEEILDDFPTGTHRPAFCILRPALDNVYSDGTALGQSIFADAIDAVKGVDNAWDSLQDEIDTTKVKVFMTDDLIDVVDEHGKPVPVPMSPDNLVVRKLAGQGGQQMLETFQPNIRTDSLVSALNIALAELGALCGFGPNYLRFDKDGGLKTAKEVSSDNSTFARNIRKHENEIEPQLEGLLGCLVDCMCGTHGAQVNVRFDDSIISDTDTEKTMFMAEIGAGVRAPWEYRAKFLGEGEEEARAAIMELGGFPTEDALPGTLE